MNRIDFDLKLKEWEKSLNDKDTNIQWLNKNIPFLEMWLHFWIKDFKEVSWNVIDLIMKNETEYFIDDTSSTIPSTYRNLVFLMLKYLVVRRQKWIRDYLFYLEKWSFDYYKYQILDIIRNQKTIQDLKYKWSEIAAIIESTIDKFWEDKIHQYRSIIIEYFDIIFSDVRYSNKTLEEKIEIYWDILHKSDLSKYVNYLNLDSYCFLSFSDISDKNIKPIESPKEPVKEIIDEYVDDTYLEDRKNYTIWLIFWSEKSVKDYKRRLDKDKTKELFWKLWISKDQFDILNEKFEDQRKLDIVYKLYNDIDFVIIFELDHETNFINNIVKNPEFQHRIWIAQSNSQHFTNNEMEKLLVDTIGRYERVTKNI